MRQNETYCLLNPYQKEFMSIFEGLTEREQCILMRVAASQLKNRERRPLVEYVEPSIVRSIVRIGT